MVDTRKTIKAELDAACARLAMVMESRAVYDARMAQVITPKGATLYTVRRSALAGRA